MLKLVLALTLPILIHFYLFVCNHLIDLTLKLCVSAKTGMVSEFTTLSVGNSRKSVMIMIRRLTPGITSVAI
jgi:hypothetical protein